MEINLQGELLSSICGFVSSKLYTMNLSTSGTLKRHKYVLCCDKSQHSAPRSKLLGLGKASFCDAALCCWFNLTTGCDILQNRSMKVLVMKHKVAALLFAVALKQERPLSVLLLFEDFDSASQRLFVKVRPLPLDCRSKKQRGAAWIVHVVYIRQEVCRVSSSKHKTL